MPYQTAQSGPKPPLQGNQFTITMTPPIPLGCLLSIYINDQQAKPGQSIGGVKLLSYGLVQTGSTATFEALTDNPQATVYFAIKCPDGMTHEQHNLGHGLQLPAEKPYNPDQGKHLPPRFDEDFDKHH